ncbi:hypothetical protein ACSBR2_040693 [Camellia fascicularis]
MHEESSSRRKVDDDVQEGAIPAYLLDRETTTRAKVLSNTVKQKRKEKAGKWKVPLPKVGSATTLYIVSFLHVFFLNLLDAFLILCFHTPVDLF